jgi:membrane-associated phospholipid phosphatase
VRSADRPDIAVGGGDQGRAVHQAASDSHGQSRPWVPELVVGVSLVALTALGGLYFAFRPSAGVLDHGLGYLVPQSRSAWFTDANHLRYPAVIILGAAAAAVVCFRRDRWRAAACLVGPPLALVSAELVAKPLVGRTLGGSLSYPSGSTVGAAALATAAVLAVPPRWQRAATVVASAYALWVTVSVIAVQWHFPTDAVAGLAYGAGTVLVVDGAFGWAAGRLAARSLVPTPGGDSP